MKPIFSNISDDLFKGEDRLRNGGFFSDQPTPKEEPIYHTDQPQIPDDNAPPHPINDRAFKLLQNAAEAMIAVNDI